jgi:RNA polymerase sigma-70 factor (ECF subfamily)
METANLIRRCLKGDARAQQALYEHYLPYVLTIVRRFGIAEAEQADLIQEVFVAVFQGLDRFDTRKGDLHQWIRGLAVHKIIAHQQKRKRFRPEELSLNHEQQLTTRIDLRELEAEYLLKLIAQLPPGYRTVFNLYVVEGYSHQEISQLLGISETGSRSQLSRAKSLLRDLLGSSTLKTTYGAF